MRLAAALLRAAGEGGGWRKRFECGGRDVARWFPGHMARGLKDMRRSLRDVDGLLEVHDARIPLSGRNPALQEVLGIRPHLLVLNKMDLADLTHKSRILHLLEQQGLQHVVFTDCLTDENVKKLIPLLTGMIKTSQRYQRAENVDHNIMVIGVPNVGKSSVINSLRKLHLRKGKAAPVGGAPGITRAVLTKIQVSEKPLMYLLDTPGVLSPQIGSVETGLKLALCGAILDHLVGVEVIADYLLYVLNQQQQFSYVERYGLSEPCDEVQSVLKSIARHLGKVQKVLVLTGTGNVNVSVPNYNAAACEFIQTFRKGLLGKVMLDRVHETLD
ncbi:mitochondrial ribosome-associated GTPase 1 [Erythrolamprus reginae]|uniref:mitochondrial ribosome-associated GTPase 1 n=1 Tax=Erythrolamprus reginae TaxID=121349 RepID=UPI00396C9B1D